MDLDVTEEERAFRSKVRAFMAEHDRPDHRAAILAGQCPSPAQMTEWQGMLHARGRGAPIWPVEFSGTGWTSTQLYILEMEAAAADAPL